MLAAFLTGRTAGQSLADFLDSQIFAESDLETTDPDPVDVAGFETFIQRFVTALPGERAAVQHS